MSRPVTLVSGQWADLPFEGFCAKVASLGYDGIEIACWGDHMDVRKAAADPGYIAGRKEILGGGCLKGVIKEIMDDSNPLVKADVTYSPSVIATSISYAVIGVKGEKLNPFTYQVRALPRCVILPSELVTKANARDFYVPTAPF